MPDHLSITPDLRAAAADGRPIVALESTIISHGMPYPRNLELARQVEQDIRERGAVPATIGVIDGVLRVGLGGEEMERLARGHGVNKISRRDLPIAVGLGQTGGTTVSGTMIIAAMAGIRVFATGGIGGVHRGADKTMDVSADLHELASTNVIVVSAGAKSVLDLPRTLEYLETLGVPVLGYGSDHFPAFLTRDSGLSVDARVETPAQVARIARAKWALGLRGGLLVGVPIPDRVAISRDESERAVTAALDAAVRSGIGGKALTPFLLAALNDATSGRSVDANVALMRNNARVAADIASALAERPEA